MTESVVLLPHCEGGDFVAKARRRKKGDMSKIQSLKRHSKKRAPGRYGVALTNDDLRLLVRKIQQGKGEFIEKQTNRVTRWKILYQEQQWDLIYDKDRHRIITCLSVPSRK